jgi:CHAD domain-containing protein
MASPGSSHFAFPQAGDLLDRLALHVRNTLKSASAGRVHDLRVSIRRYSQVLAVIDSEDKGIEKIKKKLKHIMHLAGDVRDCDIAMKLLRELNPPQQLSAILERRRAVAGGKLAAALEIWLDRGYAEKWREMTTPFLTREVARKNTAQMISRALSRAARRLFNRGKAAETSHDKLHPLRIAAKKLRYTLELLPPPLECIEPIKKLQSSLGDINDYETARRIASEEGADAIVPDELHKTREKKIREFRLYWDAEFGGRNNAKKWTDTLRNAIA